MKAVRVRQFGAAEVMKIEEVKDPKAAAGQVVVRVQTIGVNPADAYIRSAPCAMSPDLPYTPGISRRWKDHSDTLINKTSLPVASACEE